MGRTAIEWATKTWNYVEGCCACSSGCRNCWALRFALRSATRPAFGPPGMNPYETLVEDGVRPRWSGRVAVFPQRWREPYSWRSPQRCFAFSRTDIGYLRMHRQLDLGAVLGVCLDLPQHRFLFLTKRPEVFVNGPAWPENAWFGVTACNQAELNLKGELLLRVPAAHRWLCLEPLLEDVDPAGVLPPVGQPDEPVEVIATSEHLRAAVQRPWVEWVVLGGESGTAPRTLWPSSARLVRDRCRAAGIPFWFKQWSAGERAWGALATNADARNWILGRRATLDGCEHHELPEGLRL